MADRDVGLVRFGDRVAGRCDGGTIVQDAFDLDSPWHHHDMHQLHHASTGSMELEDDAGRHVLPRHLAGWIPAGTRHRNSLRRIRSISILLGADSVPEGGSCVRSSARRR